MTSISIVIPTFRERARMGPLLDRLATLEGFLEVIVVDGRSDDDTLVEVEGRAATFPYPLHPVRSARGRAVQMNEGARHARGEVLLFVHADTQLPADAARWIRHTLADSEVVAGAFTTHTVVDVKLEHWWQHAARYWLRLADVRSRYTRLPYGDQAPFVRRPVFEALGGFREIPLMEDLDFSMRLRRVGVIKTVPRNVRVSGRRFLQHPIRDTLIVNVFPVLFRSGVSPARLARLYENVR